LIAEERKEQNITPHVIGVAFTDNTDTAQQLTADLVIDCTGVESHLQWLKALGIDVPTSIVKSQLCYASGEVVLQSPLPRSLTNLPPNPSYTTTTYGTVESEEIDDKDDSTSLREPFWKVLYYQQIPPHQPTGIAIIKTEKPDGYLVSTVGINGAKCPSTFAEMDDWVKLFPVAQQFLARCRPLGGETKLVVYRKEGNTAKHYEKICIDGYIALGDSVVSFNPVYGQGMSTAADGCLLLDHLLRSEKYGPGFCQKFQIRLGRQVTVPWLLATLADIRFEATTTSAPEGFFTSNRLPLLKGFAKSFLERTVEVGSRNLFVHKTFIAVMHMKQDFLYRFLNPLFWWNFFTQ
jgi:hypothetical protein